MKVLVAVDSSDSSSRAVREAMRVCNKDNDTIILMRMFNLE
jgi:nucleotide-binding universal stress UspA family protein